MTRLTADHLSANIAFMFAEHPFLDRIAAAAEAGFRFVECHFPYEFSTEQLNAALKAAGVRMNGLNTAPGNVQAGDWGLACDPARREEFENGVRQALRYAAELDVPMIHVMAGVVGPDDMPRARTAYLSAMAFAAQEAAKVGKSVLTEPLNSRDKPGYFISRSDQVAELIREVGAPNLKLMFDVYHVQIMEGDLIRRIERHADVIGHVQIAAVPSRAEPDEGEVSLGGVLQALEGVGYAGLIGCEYKPRGRTEDGLGWRRAVFG